MERVNHLRKAFQKSIADIYIFTYETQIIKCIYFSNLSTENLRYLSSEQALADVANFIKAMNKEYSLSPDVKWIVFGGSYSGSLAAWMRLKYSDLVHGSVASSSPLLAKFNFSGNLICYQL